MLPPQPSALAYAAREPVGVVAVITPWNAPFLMALKKVSAALAAGCTVVLKPAEQAPLTALRLAHWIPVAGFPPGVVNVVPGLGHEAGQALIDHDGVQMVSFTGSTKVGRAIISASARTNLKRFVLELGGKSPVIVFADAALDRAADSIATEILFKSGQYCGAGTRLYVEASIHDDFVASLAKRLSNVQMGSGLDDTTQLGPLISRRQLERVQRLVSQGLLDGLEPILAPVEVPPSGYFHSPVLLARA